MWDSIHGWFYIEAFMNPQRSALLYSAANIIHPQDGVFGIDMEDWMKLLDMEYSEKVSSVGDWVRVCSGLYKGDIGYVSSVEN